MHIARVKKFLVNHSNNQICNKCTFCNNFCKFSVNKKILLRRNFIACTGNIQHSLKVPCVL